MKNQLKEKQAEYQKLKKSTLNKYGKDELNQLLKEYNKWMEEEKKEEESIPTKKINKKLLKEKKKLVFK